MNKRSWLKLLPLLILVLFFCAFFYFKLYRYMSFEALKNHRLLLLSWYVKDKFLFIAGFILLYIILTAISVPGVVFLTIAAGFLFGSLWATLFVAIGATIGAALIFLATKTAFADFLKKITENWFKKISSEFNDNAISYMLFLRLVPLFPFFAVNIVPAFLGINLRTFVITTFFGILPGTFVYSSLGNGISVLFARGMAPNLSIIFDPEIFLPFMALGFLSLIPIVYKRIRKSKLEKTDNCCQ